MYVNVTCMWVSCVRVCYVYVGVVCTCVLRVCGCRVYVNVTCMWVSRVHECYMYVGIVCMWALRVSGCRLLVGVFITYFTDAEVITKIQALSFSNIIVRLQ